MKRKSSNRDGTGFLALPHVVMDSPAFLSLSAPASRLLLDLCRQLRKDNNGRLIASMAAMKPRGWSSNDTLTRARRELEDAGLIWQTRQGMRPNRAAWFAVTWLSIDWSPEMDVKQFAFPRGLYIERKPEKTQALHRETV
jgi:hypothetical protein